MTLDPLEPAVTRLIVRGARPGLGLHIDDGWLQAHTLGFPDAPRWRLDQPLSPDEGWKVTALPEGRLLDPDPGGPWSAAPLLPLLPDGEYLLVDAAVRPTQGGFQLGNERVAPDESRRVLIDVPELFAGVVGASPGAGPDTSGPLLGLAVLNYDGCSSMPGLLFFPVHAPGGRGTGLRLVVPTAGALVFDNLRGCGGDPAGVARWAAGAGLAAARRLAGR